MKDSVTTLPGSLGVNPYQWTLAHKDVPPEWLPHEGRPCVIGGRYGTMEIVDGRLICVVSPAPKESMNMLALEATIENPNSSGQGYDSSHASHPLNSTIIKHGYSYSHTTPIHRKDGSVYHHHTYAKGEHKVGVNNHNTSNWETQTSSASGHKHSGSGASSLDSHLASKNKRYKDNMEVGNTNAITEGVNLRFASPSRTQLAKAYVYFDIRRRQVGLAKVKVSTIQGAQGDWYFDVSSHEDDQSLDPKKLNGILPGEVTVTSGPTPLVLPQTASQDNIRNTIREMVNRKMQSLNEHLKCPTF
jgi:hypothetical protein